MRWAGRQQGAVEDPSFPVPSVVSQQAPRGIAVCGHQGAAGPQLWVSGPAAGWRVRMWQDWSGRWPRGSPPPWLSGEGGDKHPFY